MWLEESSTERDSVDVWILTPSSSQRVCNHFPRALGVLEHRYYFLLPVMQYLQDSTMAIPWLQARLPCGFRSQPIRKRTFPVTTTLPHLKVRSLSQTHNMSKSLRLIQFLIEVERVFSKLLQLCSVMKPQQTPRRALPEQ
jgi:hypothetical protein